MKDVPEKGDRIVERNADEGTMVFEKPDGRRVKSSFLYVRQGRPLDPRGEHLIYSTRDGEVREVVEIKRPSRANSRAYRTGYDRVFKGKGSKEMN